MMVNMDDASDVGDVAKLDDLFNKGIIEYSSYALSIATKRGNTGVLDWWFSKRDVLELKFDHPLDYGSELGITTGLDWWIKHRRYFNLKMLYTKWALHLASSNGFANVIEWWFDQHRNLSLKLKYGNYAIDTASRKGHISVLDAWLNGGVKLYYSSMAIDTAAGTGNLAVLDWWFNSGLKLHYKSAIDNASNRGHLHVLDWWVSHISSRLPFNYSAAAFYCWCYDNPIHDENWYPKVMDWWVRHGITPICEYYTTMYIGKFGNAGALEWWLKSGLPIVVHIGTVQTFFDSDMTFAINFFCSNPSLVTFV